MEVRSTKYWEVTISAIILALVIFTSTQTASGMVQKRQKIVLDLRGDGQNISAKLLWVTTLPKEIISYVMVKNRLSTPVVVASTKGRIYAINATDGEIMWGENITNENYSIQLSAGDIDGDGMKEILGAEDTRTLYCIESTNGTILWSRDIGDIIHTGIRPVVLSDTDNDGEDEVIAPIEGGVVYILDGANGTIVWDYLIYGYPSRLIAVDDLDYDGIKDIVIGRCSEYGTGYDFIYCIRAYGDVLWKRKTEWWMMFAPSIGAINQKTLCVLTFLPDGYFVCLNGTDGKELWRSYRGLSAVALCDINGDGRTEIIVQEATLEAVFKIVCIDIQNAELL